MAEVIPEVGTTWRNKRSGRIVLVTSVTGPYGNFHGIEWEALTGIGPKIMHASSLYWGEKYEPADAPDPVDVVVDRLTQLSSTAIRRIIDAGEAIIAERANDGVMG